MKLAILLALLGFALCVQSSPPHGEELSYTIEHDVAHHGRFKRQMMKLGTKWEGGRVNYYFKDCRENEEKTMRAAMAYIGNRTCIQFIENPQSPQRMMIHSRPYSGCNAEVGAPGTMASPGGETVLAFANCPNIGGAVHELSHSLGSFHEHARPDRDDYLTVNEEEVKRSGQTKNMRKEHWGMVLFYVPFDYGSVMMYDTHAYGNEIMKPKQAEYERTMGNKRVSFYDIEKINKYYSCKCEKELPCDNGGYTSPSDCASCVCPKGFFGKLCNERPKQNSYELAASSEWQSKEIRFNYTFTGDNFNYFSSSFAYINAPNNKSVEIQLSKLDNIVCQYGCNVNGIEIKTKEDIKIVSPIVCCPDQEFAGNVFVSKNNPTIIEMFSSTGTVATVGFNYRYV